MKKRVLTLALVLAMCLSLMVPAFAVDDKITEPETTASEAPTESTEDDAEPAESTEPADEDAEPAESTEPSDEDAEPAESTEPADEDAEPAESTEPSDEDAESPEPAPEFTDVPEGAYFEEPVKWAVEKKITNGTTLTTFDPKLDCTQAQILTFLYRAARGADGTVTAATAADMDAAVEWAKEKGMIDDSFEATKGCTRATAACYIWQAFGSLEAEKAAEFSDVDADAAFAAAVAWAAEKGIAQGYPDGTFGPDEVCNRGQIVTFLFRAYAAAEEAPAEPAE